MQAYKAIIDITNRYTMEVHAETEQDANKTLRNLDSNQIQAGGEFEEVISMEIHDIELMYPPDEKDVVVEPEQEFVDLDSLKEVEPNDTVIIPEDENDHSDQS